MRTVSGILARTGAEGLGPGINIFLGDNEAGKSTCLAFLRAMLTGYPSGRKERQAGQPLRGGPGRGQPDTGRRPPRPATCIAARARAAAVCSSPALTAPLCRTACWNSSFRGIDRQVYRNVFGFSLGELQRFESLTTRPCVTPSTGQLRHGPALPGRCAACVCNSRPMPSIARRAASCPSTSRRELAGAAGPHPSGRRPEQPPR